MTMNNDYPRYTCAPSDYENDTPPERIWLQWYQEYQVSYDDDDEIEIVSATPPLVANHPDDRTWCDEPVHEHDVEYIQTAVHDAEVARLREQIDAQAAEIERLGQALLACASGAGGWLEAAMSLVTR
jgi:hypothetical protein